MRVRRAVLCWALSVACWLAEAPVASAGSDVVWRREPGGHLAAVTIDADRHAFVTGAIWAPPVGSNRYARHAMLVAKYGPAGRLVWRRTWRYVRPRWFAAGVSVAPGPGGGVYVGGDSGWGEGWRPVVWRYSASGRLLWRRTLPLSRDTGRGSAWIAADARGVVAAVQSSATGGPAPSDGVVMAFDPSGRLEWRTDFALSGATRMTDVVGGVAIGADGRVYVVGMVVPTVSVDTRWPDWDLVVQQLSRGGEARWTRVIGERAAKGLMDVTGVAVGHRHVVVTGSIERGKRGAVWALTTGGDRSWSDRWGRGSFTGAAAAAVAPWGAVYVVANHTVYGGGSRVTRTATLRRYTLGGAFEEKRIVSDDAWASGVAARGRLYLTVGGGLERRRR